MGYNYNTPDGNTDPDGLAGVLAQQVYGLSLNAFSGFMQHEVVAFKSCYPVSHIVSDEQLEEYKTHYLDMRDVMDQHPDKIFIVLTPPVESGGYGCRGSRQGEGFCWLSQVCRVLGWPSQCLHF
jgi:hypothetical protein